MDNAKQFTLKHYVYLLIWWLSMGYALDNNTVIFGLFLTLAFFILTTYKLFGKLLILMIVVFVLTAIFPPLAALIAGASFIFFILKIKFLWNNWRALLVGLYAYGVYLMVVLFNNFFYNHAIIKIAGIILNFFQEGSEMAIYLAGENGVATTQNVMLYGTTVAHISAYVFPFMLAVIFHLLLRWLYAYGYNTDRAFYVMGLTPLIMIAFILPFLKIDIDGYEIFHGSFADAADAVDALDAADAVDALDAANAADTVADAVDTLDVSDVTDVEGGFDGTISLKSDAEISPNVLSTLEQNVAIFSPAIEASTAAATARGIYSADAHSKQEEVLLGKDIVAVDNSQYVEQTTFEKKQAVARLVRILQLRADNLSSAQ